MRDMIWRTADGRLIQISDMDNQHLIRCIGRIWRDYPWRAEYLPRMEIELIIRRLEVTELMRNPPQE